MSFWISTRPTMVYMMRTSLRQSERNICASVFCVPNFNLCGSCGSNKIGTSIASYDHTSRLVQQNRNMDGFVGHGSVSSGQQNRNIGWLRWPWQCERWQKGCGSVVARKVSDDLTKIIAFDNTPPHALPTHLNACTVLRTHSPAGHF
jgi:hypothetical protein